MNPDELMKLPPTEALIINQGAPPYIAKKVVYYQDKRFRDKAYSRQRIQRHARIGFLPLPFIKTDAELVTGFPPPATRAELELEIAGLPSAERKRERSKPAENRKPENTGTAEAERTEPDEGDRSFNPCDYIESYGSIEDCAAPDQRELKPAEPPPIVIPVTSAMFSGGGVPRE
jgi:type IV secretion system protein VirD4